MTLQNKGRALQILFIEQISPQDMKFIIYSEVGAALDCVHIFLETMGIWCFDTLPTHLKELH